MNEKAIGYMLLAIGVGIIFLAGLNIFLLFSGNINPVMLFNFPALSLDFSKMLAAQAPAGITLPKMEQEIASKEMINGPLNLFVHVFIMGFVVNIGYRIGSLGVMLLRPVIVKMKEAK